MKRKGVEMIEALNALVRPASTLGLVGALIYGFVVGKVSDEAFLGVVSIVVGFWYSQRADSKAPIPPIQGGSK